MDDKNRISDVDRTHPLDQGLGCLPLQLRILLAPKGTLALQFQQVFLLGQAVRQLPDSTDDAVQVMDCLPPLELSLVDHCLHALDATVMQVDVLPVALQFLQVMDLHFLYLLDGAE